MVRSILLILVIVLALASSACSGSKHAPALSTVATAVSTLEPSTASTPVAPMVSSTETTVITYQPPATAPKTVEGACWEQSLAATRLGAWRCMSNSEIQDPCFGDVSASTVICVRDPRQPDKALAIHLNSPLKDVWPPPVDVPEPHPWSIQTEAGHICGTQTGTSGVVNGVRVNYICDDGLGLLGDPQPGPIWTIQGVLGSSGTSVPETLVKLAVVWL